MTIPTNSPASLTHILGPGQWYLEIYGMPTASSYSSPYSFNLSGMLGLKDTDSGKSVILYPNPAVSTVYIESARSFQIFDIYNTLVQKLSYGTISNNQIDISKLNSGTYIENWSTGSKVPF
ncbi:MAG TPA: T9SS type A sorting domain-containing protein [Flavobacterium sp.]|jgi:hypothetical protein